MSQGVNCSGPLDPSAPLTKSEVNPFVGTDHQERRGVDCSRESISPRQLIAGRLEFIHIFIYMYMRTVVSNEPLLIILMTFKFHM